MPNNLPIIEIYNMICSDETSVTVLDFVYMRAMQPA